MRALGLIALCVGLLLNSGCVSLSRSEKEDLRVLRDAGFSQTEEKVKSAPLAGSLNLFFGAGNFYLATGTDESELWLVGFLDLLTWPISILWAIPQGALDAITINKKETVYYYMKTERGRTELQTAIVEQEALPPIRKRNQE
jgi:hypothetical protein